MKRTKHGFTLVELIIVIAVIGVLAAILIPTFANVIDKANAKSALSDARNTVTQYVTEAFENSSLPENIVVIVKKAGNYYLYGYNTRGDGSIQKARGGEAYKGLDSVNALFEAYSFNKKHPETPYPDSGRTDYEEATDGSFFLVPYDASGNPTVPVKGFHATKAAEELLPDETTYPTLNDKLTETVGEDTYIYHGVLLGGTYTLDNGNGGSNPTNTPAPTPKPKYTITFKAGNTNGNDAKVTLPYGGSVEVEEGSLFVPLTYSASYDHQDSDEEWYVFNGWNPADSFVVTGNAEITATWSKYTATKYTLTFNADGGTLNLASGVTSGMQIKTGTDITSYITGSSASKAEHTFKGWRDGENTYTSSSSNIIITDDITLDPIWEEITYKMTIDNKNGDETYVLDSYAIGTNVTLPVAPTKSGYVFDYWKTDNPGDDTHYAATGTYSMPGRDVTITAVWKDKYTVEYYSFDGKTKLDETKVDAGTTITLPSEYTEYAKPDTDDIHYRFTGWLCDKDGGVYTDGYTVNSDVTFTAQYLDVPKYQVSFSAGELSENAYVKGIPADFKAEEGTVVNPNTYTRPTFDWPGTGPKYTFDGWDPNGDTVVNASVTFVAQWKKVETYTVTFEQGEGSGMTLGTFEGWTNGGSLDKGKDIAALVKGSTATPSGDADFIGWKCGATVYDPATMASSGLVVTGNMTFTAQFNTRKYTVKYTPGEGLGAEKTQEYVINTDIILPTASACGFTAPEGMAFDKWQSSINGEPTYGAGAPYTISGNVTFTATWTSSSKTVTVKFYDTWNEQTIEGSTINVSGDSVNYSQVQSLAPDYWVQGSTITASITTDNTVTFNGDRHNTAVSGDEGTDYQVLTTLVGLKKINNDSTYLSRNYWLLNDIEVSGSWTALGDMGNTLISFKGIFNGNSKTVSGVTADLDIDHVGFFAFINTSGVVRNLIVDASGLQGTSHVGTITGENAGTIENCTTKNSAVCAYTNNSSNGRCGGIAGLNSGTIRNCTADGEMQGFYYIGGIAGENTGTIDRCTFKGSVNESYYSDMTSQNMISKYGGGICGMNQSGATISGCVVNYSGNICTTAYAGGIVGVNQGNLTTSIVETNVSSAIGASQAVGGVVGSNEGAITNCHFKSLINIRGLSTNLDASGGSLSGGFVGKNSGNITSCTTRARGCGYYKVGGFCGQMEGGTIDQCYTTRGCNSQDMASYKASQNVGGFVGRMTSGTISNSFNLTNEWIYAYNVVGGFCGNMRGGTIQYCYTRVLGVGYNGYTDYHTYGVGAMTGGTVVNSFVLTANQITTAWLGSFTARNSESGFAAYTKLEANYSWSSSIWDFGTTSQLPVPKSLLDCGYITPPRSSSEV